MKKTEKVLEFSKKTRKEFKAYIVIMEMMIRQLDAVSPSMTGTNAKVLANDVVCSLRDAQLSLKHMIKKQ